MSAKEKCTGGSLSQLAMYRWQCQPRGKVLVAVYTWQCQPMGGVQVAVFRWRCRPSINVKVAMYSCGNVRQGAM
jgi:hypothetical protein